jgi:putative nucleotidyltransferase with HDIG domain
MRTVNALVEAVAVKDAATYFHSRRTAFYAAILAAELGMEGEEVEVIRIAGLLHDIGKIGIPDAILLKPAGLTIEEWTVMHRHSEYGSNIIATAGMEDIAHWVQHLHERFDGGGYPDGLAGEDIPLESRLLHAADVLEAMTSPRVYRAPRTLDQAATALEQSAGTQLDPAMALPLAELIRSDGSRLSEVADLQGRLGALMSPSSGPALVSS